MFPLLLSTVMLMVNLCQNILFLSPDQVFLSPMSNTINSHDVTQETQVLSDLIKLVRSNAFAMLVTRGRLMLCGDCRC